jgi:sec-independent protein translocase protein TatB
VLNLSTGELLVIAVIALVVLGPERLPGAARQAGPMTWSSAIGAPPWRT